MLCNRTAPRHVDGAVAGYIGLTIMPVRRIEVLFHIRSPAVVADSFGAAVAGCWRFPS